MGPDKPMSQWTTKELKSYIREATRNLNNEFINIKMEADDWKKSHPQIAEQYNELIELGTGEEYRGGIGVGLKYRADDGTLRWKNKSQLLRQARALRETYNIIEDDETPEEREQAYNTFMKNHPNLSGMSYSEYEGLVKTLGAMGKSVLNEFGYESFLETYKEASAKGKNSRNILDAVAEMQRASKGQGWNTTQIIDKLNDELGLNND